MRDDAHGHEFLAVVSAVHHQGVGQSLDDGALGLAEPLHRVSSRRVRDVDRRPNLNVITKKFLFLRDQLSHFSTSSCKNQKLSFFMPPPPLVCLSACLESCNWYQPLPTGEMFPFPSAESIRSAPSNNRLKREKAKREKKIKPPTHVKEISRTSTSSYDHLLNSLTVPISSVTSFGSTWYPLGFSTSTSPLSDMLERRFLGRRRRFFFWTRILFAYFCCWEEDAGGAGLRCGFSGFVWKIFEGFSWFSLKAGWGYPCRGVGVRLLARVPYFSAVLAARNMMLHEGNFHVQLYI